MKSSASFVGVNEELMECVGLCWVWGVGVTEGVRSEELIWKVPGNSANVPGQLLSDLPKSNCYESNTVDMWTLLNLTCNGAFGMI
jgi:hypothetical protein